jgi:tetratricopeptide (TPR) repeat protein
VTDRLRALWDFDDLDASETRFRARMTEESSDVGRAELLTQLARVEGLRDNFEDGERLIEEAEALAGTSVVAQARIDLERGRLRRSSGNVEAALPLFVSSFALARDAGELFIAVDAAHMAALAAADREGFLDWTNRGIELSEKAEPSVRYWLGPLLNNLGWRYYDAGNHERALHAFERALEERERDPEHHVALELALYAVAKALRSLDRASEGIRLLERAVASADAEGRPDGWLHEELAETYAALGRDTEARDQAQRALPLLGEADPAFEPSGERSARLRELAGTKEA